MSVLGDGSEGALAVIAVFTAFLLPFGKKQRARRKQRKEDAILLHGSAGVKNLIKPTQPLAQRLEHIDIEIANLKQGQTAIFDVLVKIDKKVSPNGGTTNDIGDVVRRMAEGKPAWLENPEQGAV